MVVTWCPCATRRWPQLGDSAPVYGLALSQAPIVCAYRPVAKLARAGTQIGVGVIALANRVPPAAKASSVGVCTPGLP